MNKLTDEDRVTSERLRSLGAIRTDDVWRMGSVQLKWNAGASQPWSTYLLTLGGLPIEIARSTTLQKALSKLEEQVSAWMGAVRTYGSHL